MAVYHVIVKGFTGDNRIFDRADEWAAQNRSMAFSYARKMIHSVRSMGLPPSLVEVREIGYQWNERIPLREIMEL